MNSGHTARLSLDSRQERTALVSGAGNGLGLTVARAISASLVRIILAVYVRAKLEHVQQHVSGPSHAPALDVSSNELLRVAAKAVGDEDVSILGETSGFTGRRAAPFTEKELADGDEVFVGGRRSGYVTCCRAGLVVRL